MNSRFASRWVASLLVCLSVRAGTFDAAAQAPGAAAPAIPAPSTHSNAAVPTPDAKAVSYDQRGVVNNLYTLDQAAKKYFLLHRAVKVTYAELVGPGKLVAEVQPVSAEDYTQLVFEKGKGIAVRMPDGRIIHYPLGSGPISSLAVAAPAAPAAGASAPPAAKVPTTPSAKGPADEQGRSILENLQILSEAADRFYKDNDTTNTTYWQLVGPQKSIASITPKEGEDYRSLLFKQGHPLRLYTKDGRVIVYPPPPPPQKAP